MSTRVPRLRMFAGPNGSGKSTLKLYLPAPLLGIYLNPDEMEQEIRKQGALIFSTYGLSPTANTIQKFFAESTLLQSAGLEAEVSKLGFSDGRVDFTVVRVNSYFASVAADLLRHELLRRGISFTFETVMSHRSKVNFLVDAQKAGFRTYLYFVATDDPDINISRVHNRVKLGGHAVPETKIRERYFRSLDLLFDAIQHTNRAYIFDNSGDSADGKQTWLAEITDGKKIDLKADQIPAWFKAAVLDKAHA